MEIEKKAVADEQLDEVAGGRRRPRRPEKAAAIVNGSTYFPCTAESSAVISDAAEAASALFSPNAEKDDTDTENLFPDLGLFRK